MHRDIRYYVMERLYGMTMATYIEQRRLTHSVSIAEAVDIMIGIAQVLATVHSVGMIHCDIKPNNVMLGPGNQVYLLDFGISRTQSITSDNPLSGGSPRYIAPEVIKSEVMIGQAHLVDIYALGVMLFELLTGRPPFCNCPVYELLSRHVHEQPPEIARFRRDVPDELQQLVGDLLAKDPLRRPISAEAVSSRLRLIAASLEASRLCQEMLRMVR